MKKIYPIFSKIKEIAIKVASQLAMLTATTTRLLLQGIEIMLKTLRKIRFFLYK